MSSIAREDLLDAIRELASDLGKPPTRTEMNDQGDYSAQPYYTEFGSWNEALREAGFDPNYERLTESELLEDLQQVADDLGHAPRLKDYEEHGAYHWVSFTRAFGSWPDALRAADLDPDDRPNERRVDRETLIEDLRQLTIELGRPPTADEMDKHGKYSRRPYVREFGSWNEALEIAGVRPNTGR